MARFFFIFSGRVQGVGFRYFAQMNASKFNITGYVKNVSNGDVELEAQGSEEDIDNLISVLMKGNGFSRIDDYSVKKIDLVPDEKKFKVTY
ncbi:acylphosphatase [Clostridium sp. DSM 8431]|uniref:acylphosphatase n=1 Tax=Clostridium sp. DSM 8431 TaxID=1761781 RepID=UPI0008EB55E7|nr:acylphosphatase [Clostridium sp. DSM 8431]SFU33735.1 acylphosphatase [Clostridium sp. DSM 8431]